MFAAFFYLLRSRGLNVSLNEWLTLLEAMEKGLHHSTLTGFYQLCRAIIVKNETEYDRFDQVFLEFFKDVPFQGELPEELLDWLNHPAEDTYLADLLLVIDHILAFWGCVNDLIYDEQTRNIIKLGKGIERLDLYLSLDRPLADIRREYGRMKQFLRKSLMHHDESVLYTIDSILFEDEVSYGIVRNLLRNLIYE